jgi:osmotically-inducible protein OsmY
MNRFQMGPLGRILSAGLFVGSAAAWAQSAHPLPGTTEAVVRALQNDDALLERVANAIANDPELADVDITVMVTEGRVALAGETRSAGQAVRGIAVTRRAAGSGVEVTSELRADHPRDAAGA